MRRQLYMAIKKQLLDTLDWLVYVDYFYNQYGDPEGNLVRSTPAVFIEFAPVDWQQKGSKVQNGLQYVLIHLVNDSGYDNENRILDTQVVNHFDKEAQVYAALAGFRPALSFLPEYVALLGTEDDKQIMETMVRVNTNADHELEPFLVSIQTFATTVYDYSAIKDYSQTVVVTELVQDVMLTEAIETPFIN